MVRRFTLLELMLVVGVMMVLAAIAIPSLREAELRAKAVELPVNLEGARDAELAYAAAYDSFAPASPVATSWAPDGVPTKVARPWVEVVPWDELQWSPDGAVRCSYRLNANGDPELGFTAEGLCDLDADGVYRMWFTNAVDAPAPAAPSPGGCLPPIHDKCF